MNTTIATSWSKPFAQRVEEEARRKAEGIGGDPGSEARLATLEAIVRTAKKRGWKAEHTSGSNSGRASSRYIEVPGRGVIRVSDHQLPMTPQREYNHSVGLTGRWSDELVVDDWDEMSIDDYMARLEHGVDWREHVGSLTKSYQPERRTILLIKACDFKRHSGFALYGNPAALA